MEVDARIDPAMDHGDATYQLEEDKAMAQLGSKPDPVVTESPVPMDVDARLDAPMDHDQHSHHADADAFQQHHQQQQHEGDKPDGVDGVAVVAGSASYPGPYQTLSDQIPPEGPLRGMTEPGVGVGAATKKYKCDECNAEFTRHHNLKSHQLTHSQDKPFICSKCPMRFRRLHDLKRHGKLHTGEKPYVCNKCHRGFARGDALVRHTKGVMGCSGARNSIGGEEDEDAEMDQTHMGNGDDPNMPVMLFAHNGTGTGEDDQRRLSLSALKPPQQHHQAASHSRTYPPVSRSNLANTYHQQAAANASHQDYAPTANMSDGPSQQNHDQAFQALHSPSASHDGAPSANMSIGGTIPTNEIVEHLFSEIKRLEDRSNMAAQEADARYDAYQHQIAELQQQVAELHAQVTDLQGRLSTQDTAAAAVAAAVAAANAAADQ